MTQIETLLWKEKRHATASAALALRADQFPGGSSDFRASEWNKSLSSSVSAITLPFTLPARHQGQLGGTECLVSFLEGKPLLPGFASPAPGTLTSQEEMEERASILIIRVFTTNLGPLLTWLLLFQVVALKVLERGKQGGHI